MDVQSNSYIKLSPKNALLYCIDDHQWIESNHSKCNWFVSRFFKHDGWL